MAKGDTRGASRLHLKRVLFRFDSSQAPGASWVALVGSFNQWNTASHRLVRGKDGWWSVSVRLPRGVYPYLFIVDGFPYNDPADDGRVPCEWGGSYSVRIVRHDDSETGATILTPVLLRFTFPRRPLTEAEALEAVMGERDT